MCQVACHYVMGPSFYLEQKYYFIRNNSFPEPQCDYLPKVLSKILASGYKFILSDVSHERFQFLLIKAASKN
jgi:hypothetical protein